MAKKSSEIRPAAHVPTDALQDAHKHLRAAEEQLEHARLSNCNPRDMSSLLGQVLQARKHIAKLEGSYDVTVATVLRSKPWEELMVVVRRAWQKHPEALRELTEELEKLTA